MLYLESTLQFEPRAIVSDACASYSTIEKLNTALHPYLHSLTHETDFFSYYRLNLYNKKCPFWNDDDGICGNVACAVQTVDNGDDVPLVWRAAELGKLEGPKAQHPGKEQQRQRPQKPLLGELGDGIGESCVVEYDDECDERDYCVPEDERASAKGEYVSLVDNPERYTGYAGPGARQVWDAIYRENCFSKHDSQNRSEQSSVANPLPFGGSGLSSNPLGRLGPAAQELRSVMQAESLDGFEFEDECLEKRVFYRVISGMHASISMHLCYNYLNTTTGIWGPNLACYEERLHKHPERISNIYFNFALVARAVGKVRQHIRDYVFCSADPTQDRQTQKLVLTLADAIVQGPPIFDETGMFADRPLDEAVTTGTPAVAAMLSGSNIDLKDDFRARFRNISRLMDCVGCDKCRLWGKLQTAGYGAALKVLLEFDEHDSSRDPPLRRTELVALVNTLDRLSHSIAVADEFRMMIEERDNIAHEVFAGDALDEREGIAGAEMERKRERERRRAEQKKNRQDVTLSDIFWKEWHHVWGAYAFVLRSWVEVPMKV